jgi:predicted PurR-regulated permease PerM
MNNSEDHTDRHPKSGSENEVDYRVVIKPSSKTKEPRWQSIVIILLAVALMAGFFIVLIQTQRITNLRLENQTMQNTLQFMQAQNDQLISTIGGMNKILTPITTPMP